MGRQAAVATQSGASYVNFGDTARKASVTTGAYINVVPTVSTLSAALRTTSESAARAANAASTINAFRSSAVAQALLPGPPDSVTFSWLAGQFAHSDFGRVATAVGVSNRSAALATETRALQVVLGAHRSAPVAGSAQLNPGQMTLGSFISRASAAAQATSGYVGYFGPSARAYGRLSPSAATQAFEWRATSIAEFFPFGSQLITANIRSHGQASARFQPGFAVGFGAQAMASSRPSGMVDISPTWRSHAQAEIGLGQTAFGQVIGKLHVTHIAHTTWRNVPILMLRPGRRILTAPKRHRIGG